MENSRKIARVLGPVLIAIGASEALNLKILTNPPDPAGLVYLNGTILFAVGLAIIQSHNVWKGWAVLITLIGWLFTLAGLARMFAPLSTQSGDLWVYVLCFILIAVGIILSYQAYLPRKSN